MWTVSCPAHDPHFVVFRFEGESIYHTPPSVNEFRDLLHRFILRPVDAFVPAEASPNVVHAYQLCPQHNIYWAPPIEGVFVLALARDNFTRNAD